MSLFGSGLAGQRKTHHTYTYPSQYYCLETVSVEFQPTWTSNSYFMFNTEIRFWNLIPLSSPCSLMSLKQTNTCLRQSFVLEPRLAWHSWGLGSQESPHLGQKILTVHVCFEAEPCISQLALNSLHSWWSSVYSSPECLGTAVLGITAKAAHTRSIRLRL